VVDHEVYAVFLFPQALEALGDAIKPYVTQGHAGPQIICHEVDTGGAFVELELRGKNPQGKEIEIELMIPIQMIRMIVSVKNDPAFGFGAD